MISANDKREDLNFGYTLLPEARDLYKVNVGSVVVFTPEKFYTKFEPKWHTINVVSGLIGCFQYSIVKDLVLSIGVRSLCGVVDKPLTLYPGVLSLIPGFSSLLDETL